MNIPTVPCSNTVHTAGADNYMALRIDQQVLMKSLQRSTDKTRTTVQCVESSNLSEGTTEALQQRIQA